MQDFGLDNVTEADGLAVGRASGFVGRTLARAIGGGTVGDTTLFELLAVTLDVARRFLEPSALAGMPSPWRLWRTPAGRRFLERHGLDRSMPAATHIVWATGGGMVPPDVRQRCYLRGIASC